MAIGRSSDGESSDGDPVVREAQEANHEPVQPRSDIFIVNSERISEIRTNEETDLVELRTVHCAIAHCFTNTAENGPFKLNIESVQHPMLGL